MIYREKPSAGTVEELFNVSGNVVAHCILYMCNTNDIYADSATVYLLKDGETDVTNKQIYDMIKIPPNDTFITSPIMLDSNEKILVRSNNGDIVFTLMVNIT